MSLLAFLVSLVVAMDRNRLIGAHGTLPWRLPADLRWFRRVTLGKPIVMGRVTHESIGRVLPGRRNIHYRLLYRLSVFRASASPQRISRFQRSHRGTPFLTPFFNPCGGRFGLFRIGGREPNGSLRRTHMCGDQIPQLRPSLYLTVSVLCA